MTLSSIVKAICGIVRKTGHTLLRGDMAEPWKPKSCKVLLLPLQTAAACAGSRERSLEIDLYFFPADEKRARDELLPLIDRLTDALCPAFCVGGEDWAFPDDDISFDLSDGVLSCQFSLSWHESAGEADDVPPMEMLHLILSEED